MTDPVALVPHADQHRKQAIDILQSALDRAAQGQVIACIVITKDSDGMWSHHTTASLSVREEIGAIEFLKWDRIARTRS